MHEEANETQNMRQNLEKLGRDSFGYILVAEFHIEPKCESHSHFRSSLTCK